MRLEPKAVWTRSVKNRRKASLSLSKDSMRCFCRALRLIVPHSLISARNESSPSKPKSRIPLPSVRIKSSANSGIILAVRGRSYSTMARRRPQGPQSFSSLAVCRLLEVINTLKVPGSWNR